MISCRTLNIFIVSDATGATAEAVVRSSLVQFGGAKSNIRRFPFIRTEEQLEAVFEEAPEHACIIVFTFVSRELADTMKRLSQVKDVTVIDFMSPLMDTFADYPPPPVILSTFAPDPAGTHGLTNTPSTRQPRRLPHNSSLIVDAFLWGGRPARWRVGRRL